MSVQVSYKKQFVLGILLLIVLLAVFEIFAQVYQIDEEKSCNFVKSEVYKNIPENVLVEMCNEYHKVKLMHNEYWQIYPNQHYEYVNINSFGFRGPEISMEKPADTFRIFVVGGSTTFGSAATSDDNTVPGYLQKKFDMIDLGLNVEVINAGTVGAYSKTEAPFVKDVLFDFNPDLIIVFDGWNDVWISYTSHIDERGVEGQLYDIVRDLHDIIPYYKTPFVIRDIAMENKNTFSGAWDGTNLDKKIILWKERWNDMCISAEQKNISTLIMIQPILGTGDRTLTQFEKSNLTADEDFVLVPIALQKYVDVLPELTNCVHTADLTHIFDNHKQTIFFDRGHVGDEGNMIIAEEIYKLVLPIIEES